MTSLLISMNLKIDNYDILLIIVNYYIKIVYYQPAKIMINTVNLAEIIINIVIRANNISKLIIRDKISCLFQGSVSCYIIFLVLSKKSLLYFIHKQTARMKDKIV